MKENLLSLINYVNVPMIAFAALTSKIVIYGADWGDSISLIAVAGLYGYSKYLSRRDIIWMRTVEKEITQLKNTISSVKMKQNARSIYGEKEDNESKEKSMPKRYF